MPAQNYKAAGLNIVAKAMTGDPVKELTQYQQEKAIDITMMGAFSHGKLHGFIFGSFYHTDAIGKYHPVSINSLISLSIANKTFRSW